MDEVKSKFFVRVRGTKEQLEDKVNTLFGKVTAVDVGYSDEYAFVTEEIAEAVYDAAEKELDIINKIRFDA